MRQPDGDATAPPSERPTRSIAKAPAKTRSRAKAGSASKQAKQQISSAAPLGLLAIGLLQRRRKSGSKGLVFIARDEARAERLGAILHAFDPQCGVVVLPRFDTLPFEQLEPSREIAGRRSHVLRRLAESADPPLLITTVEAMLPYVPPPTEWGGASLRLEVGQPFEIDALAERLQSCGYDLDEPADYPGGALVHGQSIEAYPAGALSPLRIELGDGVISGIRSFTPGVSTGGEALDAVVIDPMSEREVSAAATGAAKAVGIFTYLREASLIADADVPGRVDARLSAIERSDADADSKASFTGRREWQAARAAMTVLPATAAREPVPEFSQARAPRAALRRFIADSREQGARIIFTAATPQDLARMQRLAGENAPRLAWQKALRAPDGGIASVLVDLEAGFRMTTKPPRIVISAAEVLGSRAHHLQPMARRAEPADLTARPVLGGAVVHLQRGLAVLEGLEQVASPGLPTAEMIRLRFAGDETALCPVSDLALVWPYSSDPGGLKLDDADGSTWQARKSEVERELGQVARTMAEAVATRRATPAAKISPPGAEYERFVAQFPYFPTPDQISAVEDVLRDLASGHPMDRIVCGDVGFGKTEVALRAAAATVLSGKQVALVVPTTVLARQHAANFAKRFAALGVEVGHLSRMTSAAEARRIKQRLGDGSLAVVVGTQALTAKDVGFADLGLVIIDEEQHFGAAEKAKLAALRCGVHTLTMSATPIPRTLAGALSGLRDISVIATPPVQRVPVVTTTGPLADSSLAIALRREHRRRGQSFVICPRIKDLAPMAERLQQHVPELRVLTLHGRMPVAEIEDCMMQFVAGRADILLATNIIENGLDIPRANTIVICEPERFGLAQLHQLRGRVGRGGIRAYAYLLSDDPGAAAQTRIDALEELSRPGAGFAISARDLDLRGAGDLLSEQQAGHVQMFGAALTHHLLAQATGGKPRRLDDFWTPDLHLDVESLLPSSYVPDEATRLDLYVRLARAGTETEIEELGDEIAVRFGAAPQEVDHLLALATLSLQCRELGIARIDAGPNGIALTLRDQPGPAELPQGVVRHDGRLLLKRSIDPADRLEAVGQLIDALKAGAD
ncbi:DEAD/DEAH box helicase [Rhodopseudomonas palustris]|uniref:Transcription-repair-coupling factor n=1 Tax=Rhodopseudomonas palustris TaxID=1076 RepID=A0A418V103_RHOPL|nr:DEAD/DEAH box helicase [Rhodopseudomonas palustris]